MIDLGGTLVALFVGSYFLAKQLPVGLSRSGVRWATRAMCLIVAGYCVLTLVTDYTLRVPGPHWVEHLLRLAAVAMLVAGIILHIRNDARRLREKEAAQQAQ